MAKIKSNLKVQQRGRDKERRAEKKAAIGDGYVLQATGNDAFYLMKVSDIIYGSAFELYLVRAGHPQKVCHSGGTIRTFSKALEQLYLIVAESCEHTKLAPDVKDAIEDFLGKKSRPGITLDLKDFL